MDCDLRGQIEVLREQVRVRDIRITELETRLREYETKLSTFEAQSNVKATMKVDLQPLTKNPALDNLDVQKFSRQILLPEFRVKSQRLLKGSSVLIVGCGGLGCPAAVYLAGAGVGRIGLVDYDTVEVSNLHRQILHKETRLGELKCVSVAKTLTELNSQSEYIPISAALTSLNALEIVKQFDIVLDCSDNVATRYLLNDACVICDRPLVSGSALRWEGQLTVYNLKGGPTYRCLYPTPPPPSAVTNCSDGGVLGVVPGIIGVLQGLEAIKILSQGSSSLSGKLLLFDALETRFRTVKLRNRNPETAEVTQLIDYVQFCGSGATDKDEGVSLLQDKNRITVKELSELLNSGMKNWSLVDVRTEQECEIATIDGSTNIPLDKLQAEPGQQLDQLLHGRSAEQAARVVFVCRRGNDSQRACLSFLEHIRQHDIDKVEVVDVVGGLQAWANQIDSDFPIY